MINKGLGFLSLCFFATLGTAAHALSCKGTSTPIRPVTKSAFFLNSVTNFNTTGNVSLTARSNGLAELTESLSIEIVGANPLITNYARSQIGGLPQESCGVNASVDSLTAAVEGSSIAIRTSYSVAVWKCVSANVPCPVFPADPFRTCRKEAKDRVGSGDGSVWIKVTPVPSGNTISFSTASGKSFRMDDKARFIIASLTGFAAPLAISTLESALANAITLPDLSGAIRSPELPEGPFRPTIRSASFSPTLRQQCSPERTIVFGPLGIPTSTSERIICLLTPVNSISLNLVRTTIMKERTACFVRDQLVGEPTSSETKKPSKRKPGAKKPSKRKPSPGPSRRKNLW